MTHYIIENNRWEKPRYYYRRDWVKNPMLATAFANAEAAATIMRQLKCTEPQLQLMLINCGIDNSYSLQEQKA